MSQVAILYLAALLMDMSVAGLTFTLSRRAAELGATAPQLGALGGVWIGTYAMLALVTGRISDRVGRRKVAVTGCFVAAVMALACAATTRVGLLLVLSGWFGVGLACFWPTIIAWLGEGLSGARLSARLTKFNVAWNSGLLLGFAFAGVLFKLSTRLAFYVAAIGIVLVAALLLLPGVAASVSDAPQEVAGPAATPPPKGRGFRKTAWLANFALCFALGGVSALFPQLATSLDISPDVHSGLMALGRAAALAAFVALEAVVFWRSRLWPLWAAQLLGAASFLLIGFGNATWMFALAWIVSGAVSGYTYQASIFFSLEEISQKGKGSGFHEAIIGGGMFLGPLMAGWVGNQFSLRAPYFFCGAVSVAFVAAQIALAFYRRRSTMRV